MYSVTYTMSGKLATDSDSLLYDGVLKGEKEGMAEYENGTDK